MGGNTLTTLQRLQPRSKSSWRFAVLMRNFWNRPQIRKTSFWRTRKTSSGSDDCFLSAVYIIYERKAVVLLERFVHFHDPLSLPRIYLSLYIFIFFISLRWVAFVFLNHVGNFLK